MSLKEQKLPSKRDIVRAYRIRFNSYGLTDSEALEDIIEEMLHVAKEWRDSALTLEKRVKKLEAECARRELFCDCYRGRKCRVSKNHPS